MNPLVKPKVIVLIIITTVLAGVSTFVLSQHIGKQDKVPLEDMRIVVPESFSIEPDSFPTIIESEIISEPEPRTDARLLIFGDTAFLEPLAGRILNDPTYNPLDNVSEVFFQYDYVVGNHEATIDGASVGQPNEGKPYTFSTPVESAAKFREAGIDAFSYANNHTKDYGPASVTHTIELLKNEGIETFGAGANAAEAFTPLYQEY